MNHRAKEPQRSKRSWQSGDVDRLTVAAFLSSLQNCCHPGENFSVTQ